MTRRRRRTDLPAIVKTDFARRITHGGRSVTASRECWGFKTVDGIWSGVRFEETGTPWGLYHLPSVADKTYVLPVTTCGTIYDCRVAVADGWAERELVRGKAEQAARDAARAAERTPA